MVLSLCGGEELVDHVPTLINQLLISHEPGLVKCEEDCVECFVPEGLVHHGFFQGSAGRHQSDGQRIEVTGAIGIVLVFD